MRVAFITETFPPEVNGVAMTVGRLVSGLTQRGHETRVIRPRQGPADKAAGTGETAEQLVRGLPLPHYPGLRFGLPAGSAMDRTWRSQRPDIVHIATEGPLGWSALAAARRHGLPVTSSFHTNFDAYSGHYGIGWMRGPIERYLRTFHNRTATTLVPTQAIARRLASADFSNLRVIARGVDTRLFNPQRRSQALRLLWNASADTLVATYVGRLAPEKNLAAAIYAYEGLRRIHPDARLVFVGDGPEKSALAARHPEIIFAGMRHGEDLAEHYASADVFLFPSLTETFGNVTLEAMASGLAIVAYDHAAAGEIIEDGIDGLLAPAGDEQRFIHMACTLAQDPGLCTRLRLRAAARVSRLDWEHIHDAFADTLQNVADSHARRHPEGGTA